MKVHPDRLATLVGPWAAGAGPLYDRLARAIGAAMDRGELGPGTMLPTERELGRRLAVSRTTVVAAYAALKDAGRLESRQGRGTWVAGRAEAPPPSERPFSAELYGGLLAAQPGIIELSAACPPPPPMVAEVLQGMPGSELVRDVTGAGYLPAGLPALRELVAAHVSRGGLPTRPDEVLITTGAQQAVGLAAMLLGGAGQAVLVEEATYPGALDITRGLGMRPVGVALDRAGVVPDALEDLLERVRPAFVYLVPAHQNPTGTVLSPARSRRVAELSARYRVPVVEDLALRDLPMGDGPLPAPIAAHGPDGASIAIGSASKVLWGGLRVGWIRAVRPVIERLMRLKIGADMGSPVPSQGMACALLPRMDEAIAQRRAFLLDRYRAIGAAMAEHLPDWTWDAPSGGCTLWARMPAGGDARALGQVAQRCGVNVVPGPVLSAEGGHGDRLRLPFVHEPEVIAEAVRRLAVAWELYAGAGARPQEPVSLIV